MCRQSLFALPLLALCLCPGSIRAESAGEIRIGAIYGMSGNVARYGQWATRGAELACDAINAKGGVNGRTLRLIIEDNEGQTNKAVSAYQKLQNIDHVNFVLTFLSSVALAIAPLANRAQIVQMDSSATTPTYSSPDDYTFRTGMTANQIAVEVAKALVNDFKVKRVACFTIENEFGNGMLNVFRQAYPGIITSAQTFRAGDTDFAPQLLRIRAEKVDDVWLVGHLVEAGQLVDQARKLGLHVRFFSDVYSIEGPEFLERAKGAGEGLIYFGPSLDTESDIFEIRNFVLSYRDKYQEVPNYYAAQAYDGVMALSQGLRFCTSPSAKCVKDALYNVDFQGVSGRIRFDRNGDVEKEVVTKTVKNGKFTRLQRRRS